MIVYTKEELEDALAQHSLWLRDDREGRRADLSYADLRDVDLRGANLYGAALSYTDLRDGDLRGANLSYADLHGANLRGANLRGANLSYADLRGANLRGSAGDGHRIKTLQTGTYHISYTSDAMAIGCRQHPLGEWWGFSPSEIEAMEPGHAGIFWKKWKPLLRAIIKAGE